MPFWGPFLRACLVAVLLLVAPTLSAIDVSESELLRLRGIFSALESRSIEQDKQLTQAQTALVEAQSSLAAARTSLTAYSAEVEKTLRATRAERDGWRVCAVATGVAGVLAVIVALLVK